MKRDNNIEKGGIVAPIFGIILCVWTVLASGVKTCGGMIVSILKSVRIFITAYLTSTDEERPNLINSLKSTLKATAIALAIVLVSGYCINILFDALIRTVLTFIPLFLMDAIGYLSLGILLRAVVRVCEKMNVRSDATNKARKIIEFAMSGLVPLAIYTFVTEVTAEAIYLILSCCIASWGYRKINEVRAAKASAAA